VPTAKQDFGSAIPQGDNLVRICPQRDTKRSREAKVCQLEITVTVDEEVLGFEIAVEHAAAVEVVDTLDELVREFLMTTTQLSVRRRNGPKWASTDLDNVGTEAVGIANLVHIALEIEIKKLENEIQLGL
jgi:hypothetical protein